MVAPVPTDSSSGWAWTNKMLRAVTRDTLRTGRRAFRWVVSHDNPARSGKHSGVDYPELAARTRRFSYGAPRALTVTGDGERVVFASGRDDNLDLSAARARAVAHYLVEQGLESKAVDMRAFGTTKPRGNKSQSRRVEIVVATR